MKRVRLMLVLVMVVAMLVSIPAAMGHYGDVKPGSCPNPINLNSQGVVSIAAAGSDTVDVTTINLDTVYVHFYNQTGEAFVPILRSSFEDVINTSTTPGDFPDCNPISTEDGYMDLVVKVNVTALVDAGLYKPELTDGMLQMNLVYEFNDGTLGESQWDAVRIIDNPNMGKAVGPTNANAVEKNKNK
ncbi:hypothetical protein [Methanococcoides sp. NM1]|uniref:hypothetical protein n=1 Tax=Methanococcoides sp. NM1 TaxID=1201013 RepID=UPI0010835EA4|nr:hypothetical protein [Methanococcoides sp. NM1]